MIDLDAIVSLRAIDVHGSVVAAAESLGFTPSAVSQQVKRLERRAGVALLERVGRGVILTGPGRRLIDEGSQVLSAMEQIEANLHREADVVSGHLRLAAFSTAMRGLVAPAVQGLLADHAQLTVSLIEREPWDAIELVATGRCEVALVHRWGDVALSVPEHLVTDPVGHDVADVIVPAHHRLAGQQWVTPSDLVHESWIATGEGTICRQWLLRMYDGTGRVPNLVHQSMEFQSHLALVAAGFGIALVPRLGRATLSTDLVAIPVRDPEPTREISMLSRRSMGASPAIAALLAAMRASAPGA
jgi:DNA-binding transcriptional LysR family regulator